MIKHFWIALGALSKFLAEPSVNVNKHASIFIALVWLGRCFKLPSV